MLLLSAFHMAFGASAETNEEKIVELRKKIEELNRQAEQYRGTVLQKQQQAKTLKGQIDLMNSQILRLESEINITEKRITTSEIQISDLEEQIFNTTKSIAQQKAAIGEAMAYLYERDHMSLVAALLKNPSLSDFAQQAQQVSTLNEKLTELLTNLKEQKIKLEEQKIGVEQKKTELEILNDRQAAQRGALQGSKTEKNKLLTTTKGQEAQYQKLLAEVQRQEAAFFEELRKFETDAVNNGKIIAHVTANAVPPRGTKIFSSPYHDSHQTTQGYGMTAYAKRGAYNGAAHNGWDVVSGCASPIFSIGTGKVLASGFNNGFGNWVAIRHDGGGGMVSIYAHMQRGTNRAIGTTVDADTVIGYEGTTGNSTGCHLHLSLYRDFFTYISPKNGQLNFNYFDGSVNPLDYIKN